MGEYNGVLSRPVYSINMSVGAGDSLEQLIWLYISVLEEADERSECPLP